MIFYRLYANGTLLPLRPDSQRISVAGCSRLLLLFIVFCMILGTVQTQGQENKLWTFKTKNYDVVTDLPRDQARELANHQEKVYQEYDKRVRRAGLRPWVKLRMRLYLFETEKAYLANLKKYNIDGKGSVGMFFVVPVGNEQYVPALTTYVEGQIWTSVLDTLQHEGFHQFAFQQIAWHLPIWADEGMAVYFGSSILVRNRFELGVRDPHYVHVIQQAVENKAYIPLAQMLNMSNEAWQNHPNQDLMYAQSWSMIHFLVHGDRRYQTALMKYLKLLNQQVDAGRAFHQVFGDGAIKGFEREWLKYVKKLKPDGVKTATEQMMLMADGIVYMANNGIRFKQDKEDIQKKLTQIQFGYNIGGRIISAKQPGFWEPPRQKGNRYNLILTKKENGLPELSYTGSTPKVKLKWIEYDDYYVYRITYE